MGSLVIGRDNSCDIVLDDRSVSRWHVKLDVHEGGRCRLTDLGSTNGTFVFKDKRAVGVLEDIVTLADRVKIGKREFMVRELVSLSQGVRKWTQDVTSVKSTETLWRAASDEGQRIMQQQWRPSAAFSFVVGSSVLFWLVVLYFAFGL